MPLLNDDLSLWEIAFRWAGHDPDKFWLRIPLPVRDNVRTLMDAILQGNLFCATLALEKWDPKSDAPPEFFIRHYIDQIHDCIGGVRIERKLLKWGRIERWSMLQWCERRGIPLPEFWFPPGWKFDYQWPDDELEEAPPEVPEVEAGEAPNSRTENIDGLTSLAAAAPIPQSPAILDDEGKVITDRRKRGRIACQEVGKRVWAKQPHADMKVIANSPEVQDLAGGKEFDFDVVLRWLSEIDLRDSDKRRGPKKKKT